MMIKAGANMNTWELTSFAVTDIFDNIDNKSFVVPPYQRGCVWKSPQKAQFVDTLKRGLPFGTILLYRDDINNEYQIIDGLQRCSTIFDFVKHPAQFFYEDDIEDGLPLKLAQITGVTNPNSIVDSIQGHLINWVHTAFQTMNDVRRMQYINYAYAFTFSYPSAKGKELEIADTVTTTFASFQSLCDKLCNVKIPAIVIKGDDDALPEIFERINSKGTQLSKYQIYAATWRTTYTINDSNLQDLVQYNIQRYECMSSDGTDIADFDPINYMQKKELNLFEIAYALGKKLGHCYPSLFEIKQDSKEVDGLGFSLIAACINIKNSKTKNLHIAFDKIIGNDQINLFLNRIIQCVDTAQKLVGKFNKFKVNSKNEVGPLHTEFQMVSLIANIFIARYAQYEKDEREHIITYDVSLAHSNSAYDLYEKKLKENAWKRYCLDILNSRWKGSGDKKLDSVIFDRDYYAQTIYWNDFEMALTQWHNSVKLEKREYKRVAPPKEPEKMFFALLYLSVFTAEDQADQSRYDVEHLATKNLMKKCLDRYSGQLHLPIGAVGNLCLLPQAENRSKKDKTIYDDSSFLTKSKYSLTELEEKFTFTSKSDLSWLNDSSLNQSQFEQKYMQYIDHRFSVMVSKIKERYERS